LAKGYRSVLKREHVGTVLLVDDDPTILQWLTKTIEGAYAVTPCLTPNEAIDRLAKDRVVAVVSDISMPQMSGLELLRILHQHDPDLPVVLVTGVPCIRSAAEAVEYGAFMYLVKPVDPGVLSLTVHRAVRQYCGAKVKRDALLRLGVEDETSNLMRLQSQFDDALRALWIAYQPIVSATNRSVFAYEALLRSEDPVLSEPELVLNAADRLNLLHLLGRIVRDRAAQPLLESEGNYALFVNIHPLDLLDADLRDADSALAAVANRVVFEITERASLMNIDGIRQKVRALRDLGFRIAVDDLGAGYAGLNSIAMLEPEFMKLDMTLIRNVDREPVKQKLIASLTALSRDMGHQVIAEGVESCKERDALIDLGCDYLQGYLFARPARGLLSANWPESDE
jgi:EAL domain-containing protein (putative c-di-GMP-specific phosphodiesterase class I)